MAHLASLLFAVRRTTTTGRMDNCKLRSVMSTSVRRDKPNRAGDVARGFMLGPDNTAGHG